MHKDDKLDKEQEEAMKKYFAINKVYLAAWAVFALAATASLSYWLVSFVSHVDNQIHQKEAEKKDRCEKLTKECDSGMKFSCGHLGGC